MQRSKDKNPPVSMHRSKTHKQKTVLSRPYAHADGTGARTLSFRLGGYDTNWLYMRSPDPLNHLSSLPPETSVVAAHA